MRDFFPFSTVKLPDFSLYYTEFLYSNLKNKKIFKKVLIFGKYCDIIIYVNLISFIYADVAELADALASGASESNFMWVQVPSSAPFRGVAQFGRALRSGRRGRGFKSRHLDQKKVLVNAFIKRFTRIFS